MRTGLLLAAGAAAWLSSAAMATAAECAPEKMVRVVVRNVTPGRNPAAMTPMTMHRFTERYARVEEQPNKAAGRHNLIVVNEPDLWMANLADKTGRHAVDPGPVLEFRAPIFTTAGIPPIFTKLETGCELDFLETYAPRPVGEQTLDGAILDRHQVSVGRDRIEILVRRGVRKVYSVTHYRDEKVQTMLRYLEHETGLAPDMALFAKPAGVSFAPTAAPSP